MLGYGAALVVYGCYVRFDWTGALLVRIDGGEFLVVQWLKGLGLW